MTTYETNRKWSDRYIPAIRQIVGPRLLVESPLEVDCQEATDLIVLKARDMMIAARVRRPNRGYSEKYSRQFTLRAKLPNGTKTELAKIVEGFADWMFYGHASPLDDGGIALWFLIDLNAFRAHLIRNQSRIRCGDMVNRDDGVWFKWFDIDSFPAEPPILIASSNNKEPAHGTAPMPLSV